MNRTIAFLCGVAAALCGAAVAQVTGRISEVNAAAGYFGTITATGLVKINLPGSYADDSAACTAGLVAGNVYYTSGTPNAVKIVASC